MIDEAVNCVGSRSTRTSISSKLMPSRYSGLTPPTMNELRVTRSLNLGPKTMTAARCEFFTSDSASARLGITSTRMPAV